MEVTLKIEASQLGETVVDLFKTLTDDQKRDIAKEVVTKWFTEDPAAEREAFSDKVVRELRGRHIRMGYGYNSEKYTDDPKVTNQEVYAISEYREAMHGFKTSREQLVTAAVGAAIEQYKDSVKILVLNDAGLTAAFETAKKKIEESFPHMVEQAIIGWFKASMSNAVVEIPGSIYIMRDEIDAMKQTLNEIALKQNGC
jgi:hypothetical protein